MIGKLLLSLYLTINIVKAVDKSVDYIEDLDKALSTITFNGDVHTLDPWVASQLSHYLNQVRTKIPQIAIENSNMQQNAFDRYSFKQDIANLEANKGKFDINKYNNLFSLAQSDQSKFITSINHMFTLQDQGSVRTLLSANLNALNHISQTFGENDRSLFFRAQIVDANGTCIQGQTNRLLMSLHYLVKEILKRNYEDELAKGMLNISLDNANFKNLSKQRLAEFTSAHLGTDIPTLQILAENLHNSGTYLKKDCEELGIDFEKFLHTISASDMQVLDTWLELK